MADKIVNILNAITEAKGAEFAEGFVAGVNLTTLDKKRRKVTTAPADPGRSGRVYGI